MRILDIIINIKFNFHLYHCKYNQIILHFILS